MLDNHLIKTRIAARAEEYLREIFTDRLHRVGPNRWRVGSKGSLALDLKDGELVFFDHEAGAGGDCIRIWARERGVTDGDALKSCAAWAGVSDNGAQDTLPSRKAPLPRSAPQPYGMTDDELKRAARAAHALGKNPNVCANIASRRQWTSETIGQLAGECSLGVEDRKLAFLYVTGIKLRWRDESGKRRFVFACGKPHSLWRAHMREGRTEQAIITEGETDAITLIDLGHDTGATRIFSVPSASTWPLDWRRALAGLDEVIFATDADEAGQRHVAEWAEIIRPHVGKVRSINWKAVTQ